MPRPTGTVTREEFRRHMRNDTMVPFGCSMLQLENDDFIAIHSAVASGGPHPPVNHSRIKKAWPETLRCHHSHMNHFLSGELP
jgi:hypothetical protein